MLSCDSISKSWQGPGVTVDALGIGCKAGLDTAPTGLAGADIGAVAGGNAATTGLLGAGASGNIGGKFGTAATAVAGAAASPSGTSSAAPQLAACGSECATTGCATAQRSGRGSTTSAGT